MRTRSIIVALAVATGLFAIGAVAQHEEHHQDQVAPPDKAEAGKAGGMMSGNMMSQMPQMMMAQNETAKLVDRLVTSFVAIEAEKNPAALRVKLNEHNSLLRELQSKVQAQSHMMDRMSAHDGRVHEGGNAGGWNGKRRTQEVNG